MKNWPDTLPITWERLKELQESINGLIEVVEIGIGKFEPNTDLSKPEAYDMILMGDFGIDDLRKSK